MVPCWVRGDGRRLRFFEQNIPDHPGSPQTMVRDGPEWSVLVRAGPALYGTGALAYFRIWVYGIIHLNPIFLNFDQSQNQYEK